jgi:hypothetical protein
MKLSNWTKFSEKPPEPKVPIMFRDSAEPNISLAGYLDYAEYWDEKGETNNLRPVLHKELISGQFVETELEPGYEWQYADEEVE